MKNDEIRNGDYMTILPEIESESAHLILSDIPYGIDAEDWDVLHSNTNSAYRGSSPAQKEAGNVFKSRGKPLNGWSEADRKIPQEYYQWCASWSSEWLRILKPGASAVVLGDKKERRDSSFQTAVGSLCSYVPPRTGYLGIGSISRDRT